jgi:UDP-N-acetylmuramoylalanine-D-glutamate ligase
MECRRIGLPIVFSPGYVSTDQYKNFEERGKEFKRICKEIINNS